MLIKETVSRLCGVCRENHTTQTVETSTSSGNPVEFPCCNGCRHVMYSLEYEKEAMAEEVKLDEKLRKLLNLKKRGATTTTNKTRHLQTVDGRNTYRFVPSFGSKKKQEKTFQQVKADMSTADLLGMARSLGIL